MPLLRDLALVIALAATVAALIDYLIKAEAVAYLGKGEPLMRFFGLFYAGTALRGVPIQASARAPRFWRASDSRDPSPAIP